MPLSCIVQIEGGSGPDAQPLGTEYYTTLRSEADNEVNAATVASEEAEAEIGRLTSFHLMSASVCLFSSIERMRFNSCILLFFYAYGLKAH